VSTYPQRRRMSGVYLPVEEEVVLCLPTRGGGGCLVWVSGVYLPVEEEGVWCLSTHGAGECLVSTYPQRRSMYGVHLHME
jgi:hypothetical protein